MPHVLYVEDNADNRLLVRRILLASDAGFEVTVAESAAAGIALASARPPDVILMDMSMPEMDGLTAARQIRSMEQLKQVPIVAVTALAMQGDRERMLASGCDGYISKPIDVDKLPEQILFYVRSRNERSAEHATTDYAD